MQQVADEYRSDAVPTIIRERIRLEAIAGTADQESMATEARASITSIYTACNRFHTGRSTPLPRLTKVSVEVWDEFLRVFIEFAKIDLLHLQQ